MSGSQNTINNLQNNIDKKVVFRILNTKGVDMTRWSEFRNMWQVAWIIRHIVAYPHFLSASLLGKGLRQLTLCACSRFLGKGDDWFIRLWRGSLAMFSIFRKHGATMLFTSSLLILYNLPKISSKVCSSFLTIDVITQCLVRSLRSARLGTAYCWKT